MSVQKKVVPLREIKILFSMKTKLVILIGLLFLIAGCESKLIVNPPIVGAWTSIDKPNPFEVLITDSMIYVQGIDLSCSYTVSNNQLYIKRLWLLESHSDFAACCDYYFKEDTLVICDFIPSIANYLDDYEDIELIKVKQ